MSRLVLRRPCRTFVATGVCHYTPSPPRSGATPSVTKRSTPFLPSPLQRFDLPLNSHFILTLLMPNSTHLPTSSFSDAEIRERAYYLWLDRGCPTGHDEDIWYAARALLHDHAATAPTQQEQSVAARESDPLHHFHNRTMSPDLRRAVASSGSVQRRRARVKKN